MRIVIVGGWHRLLFCQDDYGTFVLDDGLFFTKKYSLTESYTPYVCCYYPTGILNRYIFLEYSNVVLLVIFV